MSFSVSKYWYYQIKGRNIYLYKLRNIYNTNINQPDQLGRFGYDDYAIIYPDESITDGLKIEYTKIPSSMFVAEDPEATAQASLTTDATPNEDSYVNLSRQLSLAVIDYVRARLAEHAAGHAIDPTIRSSLLSVKEYYMKEFWRKAGNDASNKVKIHITQSNSAFGLR